MRKVWILSLLVVSCAVDFENLTVQERGLDLQNKVVLTMNELAEMPSHVFGKDTLVTGIVISDAFEGNFYKEIYVKNEISTETVSGMKIKVDASNPNLRYPYGAKLYISLEGLKHSYGNQQLQVGYPKFTYLSEIYENELERLIYKSTNAAIVEGANTLMKDLNTAILHSLVELDQVYFSSNHWKKSLAGESEDVYVGKRYLVQCNAYQKDSIIVETSNYARFANWKIPKAMLTVKGIYTYNYDGEKILKINGLDDLKIVSDFLPCQLSSIIDPFIKMVADPFVATGKTARFVTIYNPNEFVMPLKYYSLVKYINGSTVFSGSGLDLSSLEIQPHSSLVIAFNSIDFELYFQKSASLYSSYITGNGDDVYALVHQTKGLVDVYGNIGEDGSLTAWDYEDGVAVRKENIKKGSNHFNLSDWDVYPRLNSLTIPNTNVIFDVK